MAIQKGTDLCYTIGFCFRGWNPVTMLMEYRLLVDNAKIQSFGESDSIMTQLLPAQQDPAPMAGVLNFLPIVLIILIFYFLMYRPMKQRQKNLEQMIAALKNGDRVITNGGIYGTVSGVKENTFMLKVSDNVKIEVAKNAIASMQPAPGTTG